MSWLQRLWRGLVPDADLPPPEPLPGEAMVFECAECGKVFERRSGRAPCPECDSVEVEQVG